ncbi:hypothetical protein U9M48_039302 [Paspalum notatum var. saurae]|uniref:KIB1-4 beta-propeller domain-containing protein n=1 Tax=Paspalum notatum var. saurae TaxID=547442 RepID=A0AAQ3UJD8_PASNO
MKMAAATPSSWEELPEDLLGLSCSCACRLSPTASASALCRPWRAGASAQRHKPLPPPLPWAVARPPRRQPGRPRWSSQPGLRRARRRRLLPEEPSLRPDLTLPLPKLALAVRRALDERTPRRYCPRSPLDLTPDPLVAVLVLEGNSVAVSACKQHDAITINLTKATDIVFLHGKLYALTDREVLSVIELGASLSDLKSTRRPAFRPCIVDDPEQQQIYTPCQRWQQKLYFDGAGTDSSYLVMRYLAESSGRLFMVRRWMSFPQNARLGDHDKTFRFDVLEADLTTIPRWRAWVIRHSSLAPNAPSGVQEDCIYFMHRVFDTPSKEFFGPCVNPLGDWCVQHEGREIFSFAARGCESMVLLVS